MPLDAPQLHRRFSKLRKSLKAISRNPTVEEVHDLRTRTRRVESILHGLRFDASSKEQKLLKGLKSVRKISGKVRDMDVLTSHVVGLGLGDDPDCLIRLVHHLGTERRRHAVTLHSIVRQYGSEARTRLKDTRRKLDSTLKEFSESKSSLKSNENHDDAPLHAMTLAMRLIREMAGVPRLTRNNLHQYRIELKRLRYVLEMADSLRGEQQSFLNALQEVQDAIGEWHDWVELSEIAARLLKHDASCQLMRKIRDWSDRKFDAALQQTEQMRRRYLQPLRAEKNAQSRGKQKSMRFPGPVLVATSEIAA